eukprot:CFRG5018T1
MVEDRHESLAKLVTGDDSILTLDTLLDAFKVLYEECSSPTLRTNKNVALFLERYGDTVKEIQRLRLSPNDFQSLQVIGRGEFGEVHLAKSKVNGDIYAMKLLNKVEICRQLEKTYYWEERDVMARNINSPWIITLDYAFQDSKYLYLIMEFVPGGDLFTLMTKFDFEEEWARFYLAQAVLAVHDMHSLGFSHRDIKPDNIMLDREGNIKLADFGSTASIGKDGEIYSDTAVGTPDYVSPEVLDSQGGKGSYGKECDWWAIGIVTFEMMCGDPPFSSESLVGTYGNIMNHETSLLFPDDIPLSDNAKSLVRGFLTSRDKRLGKNGIKEIQAHPFFAGFDWESCANKTMKPPYIPELASDIDTTHFEDILEKPVSKEEFSSQRGFSGNHLPFVGFSYTKAQKWASHLMSSGQALETESANLLQQLKPVEPTPVSISPEPSEFNILLEGRIAESENRIEELKNELVAAQTAFKRAQKEQSDAENNLQLKDAEMNDLETKNKAITRKLERATKARADTLTKLEEKNQSLDREVEIMKSDLRKAEDRARRVEDKLESTEAQVAELKIIAKAHEESHLEKNQSALEESNKATAKLKEEITRLRDIVSERDEEIRKLYQEKAELEKKTSLLSLGLDEMNQKLASEVVNRETANEKLKNSSLRLSELEGTIATLTKSAEEIYSKATSDNEEGQRKLASAKAIENDLTVQIETIRMQLGEAKREKIMADGLRKALESELSEVRTQFKTLEKEKNAETGAVSERLSQNVAEKHVRINELTALVSQLEALKISAEQDVNSLTQRLQTEKASRTAADTRVAVLTAAAIEFQQTGEQQLGRIKTLETEQNALKDSLKSATEKLTAAQATVASQQTENISLLEQKSELSKAKLVLEIDLKETQRQCEAADKDLTYVRTQLKDNDQKLKASEERLVAEKAQAEAEAQTWQAKLKASTNKQIEQTTKLEQNFSIELADAEARVEALENELLDVRLRMKESDRRAADFEQSYHEIKQELEVMTDEVDNMKLQTGRLQAQQRETYTELDRVVATSKTELERVEAALAEETEEKELFQAQAFRTQEKLKMTVDKLEEQMRNHLRTSSSKQDWKEKREDKMLKQELKNYMRKFEEEVAQNRTLQEEKESLAKQLQQYQMDAEDLACRLQIAEEDMDKLGDRTTVSSFDRLSIVDIPRRITNVASRRTPLDLWMKIPKSKKNLKKGWEMVFVRCHFQNKEIIVYSKEPNDTLSTAMDSSVLMTIDFKDIQIARAPNKNEAHSAKSDQLPLMFYIIYYPSQSPLGGGASTLQSISSNQSDMERESGLGLHRITGHLLKETTFSKPAWCMVCSERIWSLKEKTLKCANVSMQKEECPCTIHSRCKGGLKTHLMCSVATQAQQQFFLCKSIDERSQWVQTLMSEVVKKSKSLRKHNSKTDMRSMQSNSPSVKSLQSHPNAEMRRPMKEASLGP